ncbi:MAG: grxC [Burkholderiales bacterium]|jgi:glutaredoxin|nr:grxC [Burkholderiales bacterium]
MTIATAVHPPKATLYRMVMDKHVCPYGLKAKDLLRRQGFMVEDHWLTSREATDAFKAQHGVKTTPQDLHQQRADRWVRRPAPAFREGNRGSEGHDL